MFSKFAVRMLAIATLLSVVGFADLLPARAEYPDKPVTLVVPYRAGGSIETMARVLAPALSKELGQNVVVQTKPGAGGAVGATDLAASPPDGYKIMMIASSSITWPPLAQKVDYTHESLPISRSWSSFSRHWWQRRMLPSTHCLS